MKQLYMNTFDDLYRSPLRNIMNVTRYSGMRLIFPETVDSHSMDMTMIGLHIVNDINTLVPNLVNKRDFVYRCVVHDLDEAVICDVPRSLKYHSDAISSAIDSATKEIMRGKLKGSLVDDITNAKDLTTIEGRLVKFLDVYQCCFILYREVNEIGNLALRGVQKNAFDYLSSFTVKKKEDNLFKDDDPAVRKYLSNLVLQLKNIIYPSE